MKNYYALSTFLLRVWNIFVCNGNNTGNWMVMKDFTADWYQYPNGYISDFRITEGVAKYKLSWWRRLLMPWTVIRFYKKPTHPFPHE